MKSRFIILSVLLLGTLAGITALSSQKQSSVSTSSEAPLVLNPRVDGLLVYGEPVSLTEAQARLPFKIPSFPSHEVQEIWVSKVARDPADRALAIRYTDGMKLTIAQIESSPDWERIIENVPVFTLVSVNGNSGMGKSPGFTESHINQYAYPGPDGQAISNKIPYPGSVSWWQNGLDITLYSDTMKLDELLVLAESLQW